MALSGVITNNFRTGYQLRIEWSATQNVSANQSTITARMYLKSLGSGYNIVSSAGKTATIILDGTTYTDTVTIGLSGNQDKLLFTVSKTVNHSSAGEKSFSLGGSLYMGISFSSGYTGTVTLSTTNFALNTIPRTSNITSFPNFTIGSGATVSAPRNSGDFRNEYHIYVGGTPIYNTGKLDADSYTFTAGNLEAIYAHIPNATSVGVTAYVNTFNGTTLIGQSNASAVAYVGSDIIPTISSVTAAETVTAIANLALGANQFAQSLSRIRFTINGATEAKSSPIASYKITFDGVNYGQNGTTGAVNKTGNITATATVTDTRGRTSAARTVVVNLHAYTTPSAVFNTVRNSSTQSTVNTSGSAAISSLNGKNQLTYKVESKLKTATTWGVKTGPTALAIGTTSFNPAFTYIDNDTNFSYDFRLTISDRVGGSIAVISSVGTEAVPMSWGKTGSGVGKIWEQGALDVGGDIYMTGTINAQFRSNIIPAGANLDNYTTAGMYYCPANVTVATLTNCPTGGNAFSLLVETHAGTKQTITRYGSNDISTWVRNKYSTWGTWYQVWGSDGSPTSVPAHNHSVAAISLIDHTSSTSPNLVGVLMGTGNPPTASSVPQGTIFLKYV